MSRLSTKLLRPSTTAPVLTGVLTLADGNSRTGAWDAGSCKAILPGSASRIRLIWPTAVLVLALFGLTNCGHRADIAGPIDTTDFVIPAGATVTATADTTINASNKIQIDGTLYIAPGANVTFKSPSVTINGTVQNLATRVTWWGRTAFTMRRLPDLITARVDRLLGREPAYLDRGPLDCFSPQSRIAPPKPNPPP